MTTLIEKEALLKKFETGALLFQPEVREIIEEQPEAIVRCKDCVFSLGFASFACPMVGRVNLKDNDFCSRGERRKK